MVAGDNFCSKSNEIPRITITIANFSCTGEFVVESNMSVTTVSPTPSTTHARLVSHLSKGENWATYTNLNMKANAMVKAEVFVTKASSNARIKPINISTCLR